GQPAPEIIQVRRAHCHDNLPPYASARCAPGHHPLRLRPGTGIKHDALNATVIDLGCPHPPSLHGEHGCLTRKPCDRWTVAAPVEDMPLTEYRVSGNSNIEPYVSIHSDCNPAHRRVQLGHCTSLNEGTHRRGLPLLPLNQGISDCTRHPHERHANTVREQGISVDRQGSD